MDLKDLKPKSDTLEVIIVHPVTQEPILKDDGTEMSITVYLPHSKSHKEAVHDQVNKRITKMQKKNRVTLTSEEMEEASLELLAKITKKWDIVFNGETPKLTVSSAMDLYREFPWIKEQIEAEMSDAANFTKA